MRRNLFVELAYRRCLREIDTVRTCVNLSGSGRCNYSNAYVSVGQSRLAVLDLDTCQHPRDLKLSRALTGTVGCVHCSLAA